MIEILTALPAEAAGLSYNLQRDVDALPFPQYYSKDERIRLTITGPGKAAAAAAVGAVLGRYRKQELSRVQLVNFGSCAAVSGTAAVNAADYADPAEDIEDKRDKFFRLFAVNKITDADSGKTYYPDMWMNIALPEACIVTGSRVYKYEGCADESDRAAQLAGTAGQDHAEEMNLAAQTAPARKVIHARTEVYTRETSEFVLYDMEASAIYEAASLFLGPHQLHFLKGVTDFGSSAPMKDRKAQRNHFAAQMQAYTQQAAAYIDQLKTWKPGEGEQAAPSGSMTDMAAAINNTAAQISEAVLASVAMQHEIRQLVRYGFLAGLPVAELFEQSLQGTVCSNRREGKTILERFRSRIQGSIPS